MLVRDNPTLHRYEAVDDDGTIAGFIDYRVREGRHWLIHTELSEAHKGSGVASFLVRKTLDDLRARSGVVVPTCPFVGGWIRRHPEYQDLVDQETLREFKRSRGAGRRRTVATVGAATSGGASSSSAPLDAEPPAGAEPAAAPTAPAGPCAHLPSDLRSLPSAWPAEGCAECIAAGHRNWVHLRVCQRCGHVGCCDNSPGKHGTAHARQADHPLIRSYEPGENWWYCYIETVTFQVDGAPPAPSYP